MLEWLNPKNWFYKRGWIYEAGPGIIGGIPVDWRGQKFIFHLRNHSHETVMAMVQLEGVPARPVNCQDEIFCMNSSVIEPDAIGVVRITTEYPIFARHLRTLVTDVGGVYQPNVVTITQISVDGARRGNAPFVLAADATPYMGWVPRWRWMRRAS